MCRSPNPSRASTPDRGANPNPSLEGGREEKRQAQVRELARRLSGGDAAARVEAARDVRRMARASAKARTACAAPGVVGPLVAMLASTDPDARRAALLALLNLAVRNQRNKDSIVESGALPHLIEFLSSENNSLRELAAAAVLTLSASDSNKPIIATSGAVPHLVHILLSGSIQGKVDAVTTLYNLTTCKESPNLTLPVEAVRPLLALLKDSKKYSKFAEKATALLEILSESKEGRDLISDSEGGILTLVETVEEGSLISTECAVGVLLSLCRSCRKKYRELILKEGAIPGLLVLTVEGTKKAQDRARELLDLLRDDSKKNRIASKDLETIVYNIAARVDGPNKAAETAKKLLQDMVRRNMELTVTRLQLRAASCTPKVALT